MNEYISKLIQDDKLSLSVDKSKSFGFQLGDNVALSDVDLRIEQLLEKERFDQDLRNPRQQPLRVIDLVVRLEGD